MKKNKTIARKKTRQINKELSVLGVTMMLIGSQDNVSQNLAAKKSGAINKSILEKILDTDTVVSLRGDGHSC